MMKSSIGYIIAIILTACVTSAITYIYQMNSAQNDQMVVAFNCEESGGSFSQNTCQCPKEPTVAGAPAYTYHDKTGYCTDSFGIPGGKQGEIAKKLQEVDMMKN